ncbi:MAG: GHKL domain-containing protein [Clostridia bacterium]|nr:GHKL domain-containing protein [Clostridia bacterium]
MIILRDISILWSLIHTLIMFICLYEPRYPKSKSIILTLSAMFPLILVNLIIFNMLGSEKYMSLMLLTLSLPSLVFFFILAKHRDGRFVFTFCMVDTIVLEIIYITNIADYYIPGDTYLFMFLVRLFAFPLMEYFLIYKHRDIYLDIQNRVSRGWWLFAAIGAMFYLTMTLSMSRPTVITERPEQLPALILIFILMPLSYMNIFFTLRHQQKQFMAEEEEKLLRVQVSGLKERMEQFSEADRKFRVERHNFRHKMQTIAALVETREYGKLRELVDEYSETIKETQVRRYSKSAVIDATLASYLQNAKLNDIRVTSSIAFPDPLPVNEAELATVLANGIENAINACKKLEPAQRFIDLKVLSTPRFMLQIKNSCNGEAEFDKHGIPVSSIEGHGLGTRSIVAVCEKYGAFYEFKAEDSVFRLRISF